jgi:hypothetical protein
MLYSITRIPILVVLFTGLIVFLVSMQPSTVSTLTSEENATTTPLAQEIITTATTTATGRNICWQ